MGPGRAGCQVPQGVRSARGGEHRDGQRLHLARRQARLQQRVHLLHLPTHESREEHVDERCETKHMLRLDMHSMWAGDLPAAVPGCLLTRVR